MCIFQLEPKHLRMHVIDRFHGRIDVKEVMRENAVRAVVHVENIHSSMVRLLPSPEGSQPCSKLPNAAQ
jgi:hypothetical protein